MRLGICATKLDNMELVKEFGYDFLEYSVRDLDELTDAQVSEVEKRCDKLGLRIEAMNCMLPQRLQVTGPQVDMPPIKDYLVKNVTRAALFGCETIVFGSGWSRSMPEGFSDKKKAFQQLVEYLHMASDICGEKGITIAIEPLAGGNIIAYISEGHYLCHITDRKNVRLLADVYAMTGNIESWDDIVTYAEHMEHLHFCSYDRKFPRLDDAFDYAPFFDAVKRSGFDKRISIEANLGDVRKDYADAMSVFKRYLP